MPLTDSLRDDILASVPSLRAFAISLSGNGDRADDLVQETLLRAIANIDSFQPGSNLPAWLFTILRNLFRSDYRKRRREVEDAEGNYAKTLKTQPAQNAHLEFEEFRVALDKLPQGLSQAATGGGGRRWQLCQDAENPAGTKRASRVRGIPRGTGQASAGPARSADPGGRLRLLL